jgi:hypothetical protein
MQLRKMGGAGGAKHVNAAGGILRDVLAGRLFAVEQAQRVFLQPCFAVGA